MTYPASLFRSTAPIQRRLAIALVTAGWIAIGAGNAVAAPRAILRVTPTALDFGDVPVGATSAAQVVSITNISPAAIVMNDIAGGAPVNPVFGAIQNCGGATLSPGASC